MMGRVESTLVQQRENPAYAVLEDFRYRPFEDHLGAGIEAIRIRCQGAPFTAR